MNGWLCYNETGAEKNAWFIDRLIREAEKRGISLSLKIIKGFPFTFDCLPDFAIVRFICPLLNDYFQSHGVRVFNNALTARVACDKWLTYQFLSDNGMPVLETELCFHQTMSFPLVAKSRDGHGGNEVFWVENEPALEKVKNTLGCTDFIVQKPSDILGKDMRVYAVGGEIIACVLRTAKTDFRSNFSLGGSVTLVQADEKQKKLVKQLYELLHFDFVGIDFLPTKNGWVINEIEDSAGARMLYSLSDMDIACTMIEHVQKTLL